MIDLLNDPQIRAELTNGVVIVASLAVLMGLVAMVVDFVRFLKRGRGQ